MKKLFTIITAAALSAALLTSCGEVSAEDEIFIPIRVGNTVNYETARAVVGTILEQVTLDGFVTTPYTMDLAFTHMGGKIVELNVRQDMEVEEGDVIAVLSDESLEEDIQVQKIKLDSAQSVYDNLRAQHASEDDIEFARIDLEIEQFNYDTLVGKRDFLTLKAPFSGRITSMGNYRVGSTINVNSTLCTISDSSKVALTVSDRNAQLHDVSFGTRVDIKQGALAATTGRVVDMITEENRWGALFGGNGWGGGNNNAPSEIMNYVIQCDDEIEFSELGGIEVTFTTFRRDDAVIVPSEAVFESTDSSNTTSNYVNVLMKGIKVETPVTVGVTSGGRTEILSGLDGGETLILPSRKKSDSDNNNNNAGAGANRRWQQPEGEQGEEEEEE